MDKFSKYEDKPVADKFSKYEDKPVKEISKTESAARSIFQNITSSLGDELAGVANAFQLGGPIEPGSGMSGSNLKPENASSADIQKRFITARDAEREANEASEKANPGTYFAGSLIGSLPSVLATGGGGALAQIGKNVATGALSGFGSAEGDLAEQAKHTALSGLAGGALPALGAGVRGIGKGVVELAQGINPIAKPINKLSDFAVDVRSKFPGKLNTAIKEGKEAQRGVDKEKAFLKSFDENPDALITEVAQNAGLDPANAEVRAQITNQILSTKAAHKGYVKEAQTAKGQATKAINKEKKAARISPVVSERMSEGASMAADMGLGALAGTLTGAGPLVGAGLGYAARHPAAGELVKKFGGPRAAKVLDLVNKKELYGTVGKAAGATINNPATRASTQALINMSGDDARQTKQVYDQRVQEAVDRGQPEAAAKFTELSKNPAARAAKSVIGKEDNEDEIDITRPKRDEDYEEYDNE